MSNALGGERCDLLDGAKREEWSWEGGVGILGSVWERRVVKGRASLPIWCFGGVWKMVAFGERRGRRASGLMCK